MRRYYVLLTVLCACACQFLHAQVTAHYINVGQAASALIEFKSGVILIDAGGENTEDDQYGKHLVAYINKFFQGRPDLEKTLDAIIISHPHIDHTKYLMDVMEAFEVRALVDNGGDSGSGISQLKKARQFANEHGIDYYQIGNRGIRRTGRKLALLDTEDPTAPEIRVLSGLRGCSNKNNDSIAVHVKVGTASFLFIGDAENEADDECEAELDVLATKYQTSPLLKAAVYHVAHHGSYNGTSDDFMTLVSPRISVISAGDPKRKAPGPFHAYQFGHPRQVAVTTVMEATAGKRAEFGGEPTSVTVFKAAKKPVTQNMTQAVYCTCWDGDIVVRYEAGSAKPTVTTLPTN